jgi:hypothetical protein
MEKTSLSMIVNDLRSRRDALSLAHEQLKSDSDSWNKCVIVLSLGTGIFESAKIQMGWNNNIMALVPIALSSVIACISALIMFRNFPSQMEIILQSQSLLTHTLTNARNENSITPVLFKEYNDALEKRETALYPDIRKRYMVQSHRNLISIMKQESKYFGLIELINSGYEVNTSSDSENSSTNPFDSGNTTPNPFDSGNTTPNPFEKNDPEPLWSYF